MTTDTHLNSRQILEEAEADESFLKDLAELQAHGIMVRAGISPLPFEGRYDIDGMATRLTGLSDAIAEFVFNEDLHDDPYRKSVYEHPIGPLSFWTLAHDVAQGHEAVYELTMAKSIKDNTQSGEAIGHWILAVLLYQYADDACSAKRMGYRRGDTPELYRAPASVLQIVHMMLFNDAEDDIHDISLRLKPYYADEGFADSYQQALFELAITASRMTDYRTLHTDTDAHTAVSSARNAADTFRKSAQPTETLWSKCIAAAFYAEWSRGPMDFENDLLGEKARNLMEVAR